jgi:hypothetical protein
VKTANDTTAPRPEHATVVDLAINSILARFLFSVIQAGVPDLLADGPLTAEEIAGKTGLAPDPVHRALRGLTGPGFFTLSDNRFALTESGRTLVSGHPTAARELVLSFLGPTYSGALFQVDETLRTGRTGVELAFGKPLFDHLAEQPAENEIFGRSMIGIHGTEPAAVAAAYDFSPARSIVDVGGGVGTLLRTVLQAAPQAGGVLVDLPGVVAEAELGDLADRITVVPGDFFAPLPAGGDVYLLSHIIHDWPDDESVRILSRAREALAPGGRILLVEMVLPEGNGPHPAKSVDLIMLFLAGGRERTSAEYRSLLARAGLELTQIIPTDSAVSIVEARIAAE